MYVDVVDVLQWDGPTDGQDLTIHIWSESLEEPEGDPLFVLPHTCWLLAPSQVGETVWGTKASFAALVSFGHL